MKVQLTFCSISHGELHVTRSSFRNPTANHTPMSSFRQLFNGLRSVVLSVDFSIASCNTITIYHMPYNFHALNICKDLQVHRSLGQLRISPHYQVVQLVRKATDTLELELFLIFPLSLISSVHPAIKTKTSQQRHLVSRIGHKFLPTWQVLRLFAKETMDKWSTPQLAPKMLKNLSLSASSVSL